MCNKLVRCGRIHWRLSNETASNRAHIFYKPPVDSYEKNRHPQYQQVVVAAAAAALATRYEL